MSTFSATRPGFGFEKPTEGYSNDWLTPLELVDRLGQFDLDPCAAAEWYEEAWIKGKQIFVPLGTGNGPIHKRPYVLAKENYAPPKDGLCPPWQGRVFCNPPYGPHVNKWADKMASHSNGILLIFSRTETKAWRSVWAGADAILFPVGRVSFLKPDGSKAKSGTAPSALVAYGDENVRALERCGIAGALVVKPRILTGITASQL